MQLASNFSCVYLPAQNIKRGIEVESKYYVVMMSKHNDDRTAKCRYAQYFQAAGWLIYYSLSEQTLGEGKKESI